VDPRRSAAPEIAAIYAQYPHIGAVLPAVGYSASQLAALQTTLQRAEADVVVAATPVDLASLIRISAPIVRARYDFEDIDDPGLAALVDRWAAGTWLTR
jgi:predicted GTPase